MLRRRRRPPLDDDEKASANAKEWSPRKRAQTAVKAVTVFMTDLITVSGGDTSGSAFLT